MAKHSLENPETSVAQRLRLSDPDRTMDMTPDSKMDIEDSTTEDANPKLMRYETPLIFAFPTSLALSEFACLEYDCTPWLTEPLDDLRLLDRIFEFASPYRRKGDSFKTPKVHLGSSSYVHFYAAFTHLETIGKTAECGVFKKWHDEVIMPAFQEATCTTYCRYRWDEIPPPHELAVLNSRIERDEIWRPDAPLMPVTTEIRPQNLSALWNAIVHKTTQPGFEEYGDVFLVAVFDHMTFDHGSICFGLTSCETQEESLNQAMELWKMTVDMRYVPKGNMEYRVESTWRI